MEKVIKFLPALAILLASGLAVATTSKSMAPQYYKSGTEWRSLAEDGIVIGGESGEFFCLASPAECTAEGFDGNGNPVGVDHGILQQNP